MQAFSLNPESPIPVKLQLKAQVKYQIRAGLLRPGDQLPALRDLSAGLGVHLNTVVRAFDELADEGFLYSQQGKGVFVADDVPGQRNGAAMRSLLAGVLQSAREWAMTPEEVALAMFAQGQLARQPQAAPHRLLLVGGNRPQVKRLQAELESAVAAVVVPALADELEDRVRPSEFRTVACTLFHEAAVRRFLPRAAVTVLAPQAARDQLAALPTLPAGTPVAVAARDWLQVARVRRSLELGGGTYGLEMIAGATPADLAPVVRRARFVLAAGDAAPLVRQALEGITDTVLIEEPVALPEEVLPPLRQALGAPAAEARLHVRSSWI
ncbi:MAG TPA: GntR family transcriptional regulator [Symbiobacteriaceae bacterium]|nr:GntR family transcriptional regulator [Symbiobacteriaceae bacterium]